MHFKGAAEAFFPSAINDAFDTHLSCQDPEENPHQLFSAERKKKNHDFLLPFAIWRKSLLSRFPPVPVGTPVLLGFYDDCTLWIRGSVSPSVSTQMQLHWSANLAGRRSARLSFGKNHYPQQQEGEKIKGFGNNELVAKREKSGNRKKEIMKFTKR